MNNLGDRDFFQQRYRALLAHYGLTPQAIGARKAHENGDAEQSHYRYKDAIDQALMLRGSRDFDDRRGLRAVPPQGLRPAKQGRADRFAEERPLLGALPWRRVDAWHRQQLRVAQGSTIRVGTNVYSVPSQLIGEKLDVHVMAECLEVWFGAVLVECVPRLRGRNKHSINYRHVIDWLVRKPGAFAAYRYQDALFPTSRFRRVYDALRDQFPGRAAKDYLRILELAAKAVRGRGRRASWTGSWRGGCPSRQPSSRSSCIMTWACHGRWRSSSPQWTCRSTTCYSKPGRISHYQSIRCP